MRNPLTDPATRARVLVDPDHDDIALAASALAGAATPLATLRAHVLQRQAELQAMALDGGEDMSAVEPMRQVVGALDREVSAIQSGFDRVASILHQLRTLNALSDPAEPTQPIGKQ